jgi:hypothetical protein
MRDLALGFRHRRRDRLAHLVGIETCASLLGCRGRGGPGRSPLAGSKLDIGQRDRTVDAGAFQRFGIDAEFAARAAAPGSPWRVRRALRGRLPSGSGAASERFRFLRPAATVWRSAGVAAVAPGFSSTAGGAGSALAGFSPGAPIRARSAPTGSSSPSFAHSSEMTPSSNMSTSKAPLCVSTTAITSPFLTALPA